MAFLPRMCGVFAQAHYGTFGYMRTHSATFLVHFAYMQVPSRRDTFARLSHFRHMLYMHILHSHVAHSRYIRGAPLRTFDYICRTLHSIDFRYIHHIRPHSSHSRPITCATDHMRDRPHARSSTCAYILVHAVWRMWCVSNVVDANVDECTRIWSRAECSSRRMGSVQNVTATSRTF